MSSATELDRLVVRLVGDATSYTHMMDEAVNTATSTARRVTAQVTRMAAQCQTALNTVGTAAKAAGSALSYGLTLPLLAAGAGAVKLASDAEETASKFSVVFSEIAEEADAMAANLDAAFGMSSHEARTLLSDTGNLLTGFGFTQQAALEMSNEVQKLAVDLASFTNVEGGASRASEALTKALMGEREMAKALGIAILEEDVKRQVAINSAKGMTFETERQAKAYATLLIAQDQAKNAIGDFARTQGSFANQLREVKADLIDVGISFGKVLLPYAQAALSYVRKGIDWFKGLSDETRGWIVVVAGVAAAVGPVLLGLGTLATAAAAAAGGLATIGSMAGSLAPVVAVVAAIGAAIVAVTAAAAGLAYWLLGPEGIANAWNTATSTAAVWYSNVMGFLANFQHNISALFAWLPANWGSVLEDMLRLMVTWATNSVHNAITMVKTLVRVWVAWQGYVSAIFKQVFTVDFVKAVIDGIKQATIKFFAFAGRTQEWMKAAFSGESIDIGGFFDQLDKDFQAGANSTDIFGTLKGIMREGMADLNNPLKGFESSIKGGPAFKFDRPAAPAVPAAPANPAKAAAAAGLPPAVEAAMPPELVAVEEGIKRIKDLAAEPIKLTLAVGGMDALLSGTVQAEEEMEKYMTLRNTPENIAAQLGPEAAGVAAVPMAERGGGGPVGGGPAMPEPKTKTDKYLSRLVELAEEEKKNKERLVGGPGLGFEEVNL